jgi:hypothetical protein
MGEGEKEELMVTVPYNDFIAGIEALRIIVSARQMLKSGDAYASVGLKTILGINTEDGDKDAGKD